LPVVAFGHFRVGIDEFGHLVRINVVRICGLFIARNVVHPVVGLCLDAEGACPLSMWELAVLVLTFARVAKIGALEDVAVFAIRAFVAVT
jgi:hypothetical protein